MASRKPLIKIQKIDTQQVDRQYKINKETNIVDKILHRYTNPLKAGGELVCSGSLWLSCTSDTHHDTVKTTRTSYDMDFVLDTTKTLIMKSLKMPKGLSESVKGQRDSHHMLV